MSQQAHAARSSRPSTATNTITREENEEEQKGTKQIKKILDLLPPWVLFNLRNPKSWKLFLRSWLASWAALVIILPDKSLKALGNAAFFSLLASVFLPAYLPVQLFIKVMSTLIIGLLLGWGIGAAAMRAALAARDQVLLRSTFEKVQSSAAGIANPEALFIADIFEGVFLDERSSIVYGCFLAFGTFIFALIRAYAPGLTFMSVFGTITLDIYCTYGPLFPIGEYTIVNSLLISTACYTAIAVVVSVLIFPETSNHLCLATISSQLEKLKGMVDIQSEVLNSTPEDLSPGKPLVQHILGLRSAIIGNQQLLTARLMNVTSEVSWGKLSADDVKSLEEPLLGIMARTVGFYSFVKLIGSPPCSSPSATDSSAEDIDQSPGVSDTKLLRHITQQTRVADSLEIRNIFPLLHESTLDLREACGRGFTSVKETIDFINERRWSRRNPELERQCSTNLDNAIKHLTAAVQEFKESKRLALLHRYEPLLASTNPKQDVPLRSLHAMYVFAANMISVAHATLLFMEKVQDLVAERKAKRLWFPREIVWQTIAKLFTARGEEEDVTLGEDPREVLAFKDEDINYRKDPDSNPPTNIIQKLMNTIHNIYKWLGTAEAKFTIKYTIISVSLWLPSVFPSTASFYFVQKGVWALIMAQTTMNIYASDQIFNYFIRLSGTLLGLVLGLVTWYIGCGRGIGNPYGIAASSAVFLIPVVWLRVFAPPKYLPAVLIGGATFALVVGYSWMDGHLQTFGNPGIGWSVAWRRCVLVVIGSAASFIIMMLPPTSGRKAVRLRNAAVINKISGIYGFLMSTWIETERRTEKRSPHVMAPEAWMSAFRFRLKTLAEQVQSVKQLTEMAKWEGNIRGTWPVKEYNALADTESEMLSAIAQMGSAIAHLDDEWRINFLHKTKVLHPNFISDVFTKFTVVSQSLRTGEPMHQVLPSSILDRLFYHNRIANIPSLVVGEGSGDIESLMSLDYVYFASGIVAVCQLLTALDELHSITKRLCGEVPLQGYERWHEEYERIHAVS